MNEAHVYLDTSIPIRRYVKQKGSETVDEYFSMV